MMIMSRSSLPSEPSPPSSLPVVSCCCTPPKKKRKNGNAKGGQRRERGQRTRGSGRRLLQQNQPSRAHYSTHPGGRVQREPTFAVASWADRAAAALKYQSASVFLFYLPRGWASPFFFLFPLAVAKERKETIWKVQRCASLAAFATSTRSRRPGCWHETTAKSKLTLSKTFAGTCAVLLKSNQKWKKYRYASFRTGVKTRY